MRLLALLFALASPSLATTPPEAHQVAASTPAVEAAQPLPATVDTSKIRLEASDPKGALADAETAVARGGGADAYAARADAKRAMGYPQAEVLADYAAAAKLDPRYLQKYNGLIAQEQSQQHPDARSHSWGKGLNGMPIIEVAAVAAAGGALLFAAFVMLRERGGAIAAPDDENQNPGGIVQKPGEPAKPPVGGQPPKKEPPKES